MVRSAAMHDMVFSDNLLAIAHNAAIPGRVFRLSGQDGDRVGFGLMLCNQLLDGLCTQKRCIAADDQHAIVICR